MAGVRQEEEEEAGTMRDEGRAVCVRGERQNWRRGVGGGDHSKREED